MVKLQVSLDCYFDCCCVLLLLLFTEAQQLVSDAIGGASFPPLSVHRLAHSRTCPRYNPYFIFSLYRLEIAEFVRSVTQSFETVALAGDDDDDVSLLQAIYDFPFYLLDTLITRLPPLALHKFHRHLYVHFSPHHHHLRTHL